MNRCHGLRCRIAQWLITGHSIATVEQILEAHYLGGRVELAESAIKKLSAVYG